MMPSKFDRILDDSLSRMDRGESLIDILAVYPDLAERIKPLLMVAMLSRAVPQPVPGYTALRVGKNQMLAEMATMQAEGGFLETKPVGPPREGIVDRLARALKQLQPAYRLAMLSLVLILAGGFFTLSASASGMADNIMQTLFFSFEQVGDLLLVKPSPPNPMGDNLIFSSDYGLPNSPDGSGNLKGSAVEGDEKNNGSVDLSYLETRQYTLSELPVEEVEQVVDAMDDEQVAVIDDKDLEKEEKEEEKDLEKEEKEEDKEADKAEKEDEKAADKAEKDADKEEKEDEKDKDKDK